jgi:L-fuconolactonase
MGACLPVRRDRLNRAARRSSSPVWPYIETCTAAFGPDPTIFEGNFPVDKDKCGYAALWNAFKRIASGYSKKPRCSPARREKFYRLG